MTTPNAGTSAIAYSKLAVSLGMLRENITPVEACVGNARAIGPILLGLGAPAHSLQTGMGGR